MCLNYWSLVPRFWKFVRKILIFLLWTNTAILLFNPVKLFLTNSPVMFCKSMDWLLLNDIIYLSDVCSKSIMETPEEFVKSRPSFQRNNKNTRTISFWWNNVLVFLLLTWTDSTHCSGVSVVDFDCKSWLGKGINGYLNAMQLYIPCLIERTKNIFFQNF